MSGPSIQPNRINYECSVVKHTVIITDTIHSLAYISAHSKFRCTGMSECKVFAKARISKPTGCPYYDKHQWMDP